MWSKPTGTRFFCLSAPVSLCMFVYLRLSNKMKVQIKFLRISYEFDKWKVSLAYLQNVMSHRESWKCWLYEKWGGSLDLHIHNNEGQQSSLGPANQQRELFLSVKHWWKIHLTHSNYSQLNTKTSSPFSWNCHIRLAVQMSAAADLKHTVARWQLVSWRSKLKKFSLTFLAWL